MLNVIRNIKARLQYRSKNTQEIFTDIFHKQGWGKGESISGTGSDDFQTRRIVTEIPGIFKKYAIRSILDIPCGDFHWMQHIDLTGIEYIGADIVPEVISRNKKIFSRKNIKFQEMNLITDPLPRADLIICRDCLVHLSFEQGLKALENIKRSHANYLLTTTFTGRKANRNIHTGLWRALNLIKEPYNLPVPLEIIVEGNTENGGVNGDKSLGLWELV